MNSPALRRKWKREHKHDSEPSANHHSSNLYEDTQRPSASSEASADEGPCQEDLRRVRLAFGCLFSDDSHYPSCSEKMAYCLVPVAMQVEFALAMSSPLASLSSHSI